ncbi:MAG TPA: LLM class F420-dependent oxidoreductase, partial [Acidimicrobiia bacterium]|nr:LLM class F420-dependent oxidoreductase [Acidimicrobiia bacterium]
HRACDARGRDPQTLSIVPFGTIPDPGKLEYYAEIGITEVVLRLPGAGRDRVLGLLDEYASYIAA